MRSKGRRREVRDCASWILKGSQNCHMSWWNFVSCKYAAWNLAQSDRKRCLLDHPLLRKCLTANLILLKRDTMRQTEKGGKVPLFMRLLLLCSPFSHGQVMHLVYPPKFGITFVSNFSWILQSSQWFCKILGGKLWQSTLWSMRKCWVQLLSCEVWWKKLLIFFSELIDS